MSQYINDLGMTYKGDFYIHRHKKNIGRMISTYQANDNGISTNDLVATFSKLKSKSNAAIKNQYKQLLEISMIDENSVVLLNQVFKNNGDLTQLNRQLTQSLQEVFETNRISSMIQQQTNIDWSNLQDLDTILQDSEADLKNLDSILDALENTVSLIKTHGSYIAGLIRTIRKQKGITISQFGAELQKALALEEKQEKDIKSVQQYQVNEVIVELKRLASRLAHGTKSGHVLPDDDSDGLTGQFLKAYLDRTFFSTTMAEALAMSINNAALQESALTIAQSAKNIQGTGRETVKFEYTSTSGEYNKTNTEAARQGKADIRLNNIQVDLNYLLGKDMGKINMSLGISNKAYKTLDFGGGTGKSQVISGGDIPLTRVFNMLTTLKTHQYLGYNVLAWTSQTAPHNKKISQGGANLTPALESLQDALFTRATVYLFGARGTTDFAGFLLINGVFYSLWEIIEYVTQNSLKSSSQASVDQAVIYSIEGRRDFGLGLLEKTNDARIKDVNARIAASKISAHLKPSKLPRI